jgi:hypothetical protein
MKETVYDKLRRNAYRNTDDWPKTPVKPIPVFSLVTEANAADLRAYASSLEAWEIEAAIAKQKQDSWTEKHSTLENQFRTDLEAETGMTDHPKAELLYWKAYERGHSSGVDGVYDAYMNMLELVQ